MKSAKKLAAAFLIVVCGMPCLASSSAAEKVTTEDLVELKDIGGYRGAFSISPDEKYIAFQLQQADIANRTFTTDWFVMPASESAKPLHVGSGGELVLDSDSYGLIGGSRVDLKAKWSPDGLWIAYLRKDAGDIQLWRSRTDGSLQEQLTRSSADVANFAWSLDGNSLYFEVGRDRSLMRNRDREEGDHGYLLNDRFIYGGLKPVWFACDKNPREPLPASQECSPTVWVVDLKERQERRANELDRENYKALTAPVRTIPNIAATRSVQGIVQSRNGSHTAWLENENPEEYPGSAASLTLYADGNRCGAPECGGQLRELWWKGEDIVFLRREGHAYGLTAIYIWNPEESGTPRLVHRGEDKLEACAIDGDRLICTQELPTIPRRIVSIDINGGKIATLFDPNPQFAKHNLGKVERLEWQDAFGNPTYGHLVLPPDYVIGKRYPLVIVQYRSRGFLKGGVGDEYPIFPLAAKGFAVLSFDCPNDWDRLARANYAKDAKKAMGETLKDSYERKMDLSALETVIDRLAMRGVIDPKRVGITGLSHGADNVQYFLAHSRYFSAAAASGTWTPSMFLYLNQNSKYRGLVKIIQEYAGDTELFDNVDKVVAPLLIQVSDAELLSTLPVHVALEDGGKNVETYVFPGEYHIKWQPQHKIAVGERAIDWFRFWLQSYEEDDSKKVEQYKRWRAMRDGKQVSPR